MTLTAPADFSGMQLAPQHIAVLKTRGIVPGVAAARGVFTAEHRSQLGDLGFSSAQRITPALVLPLHNVAGERVNYAIRPDVPRIIKGRPAKYEPVAGSALTVDVPPAVKSDLRDRSLPLVITEGPLKADSAVSHGLLCIDIFGVWNFRGDVVAAWDSIPLKERTIFLCFDSDMMQKPAVHRALHRLRDLLKQWHADVWVVYLPPQADGSKTGLDDFLTQGHVAKEVFDLADAELRPLPPEVQAAEAVRDDRPPLDVGERDLAKVTPEAWRLVAEGNRPPRLFQHGSELMRLEPGEGYGPRLTPLRAAGVRYELARATYPFAVVKQGGESAPAAAVPPDHLIEDMLATPVRPVPTLDRIVEAPVFAADGSLQTEPGYHGASRTYYAPTEGLEIPDVPAQPSSDDVARARALLLDDLYVDFPFEAPAHRAHAVGLLLLPFARDFIAGSTPLHLIEAPDVGTGKTMLVDVALLPASGRHTAKLAHASSDEEQRKRITSQLLAGNAAICIDNVTGSVKSGALAAALTTTVWEDRLLGGNRLVCLPIRSIWAMTGNNPQLSTELARRSVPIRLNANEDEPWRRNPEGFRHSLPGWALEHRGELIWAALTLIQAWIAAGRPRMPGKRLASYESWSDVIGGILLVAGIPGFLDELDALYERADADKAVWRAVVESWHSQHGTDLVSTAELLTLAEATDGFEARGENLPAKRVSFGKQLRGQVGRVFGRYQVAMAGKRQGAQRWRLQVVDSGEGREGREGYSDDSGNANRCVRTPTSARDTQTISTTEQNTLTTPPTLTEEEQNRCDLEFLDEVLRNESDASR